MTRARRTRSSNNSLGLLRRCRELRVDLPPPPRVVVLFPRLERVSDPGDMLTCSLAQPLVCVCLCMCEHEHAPLAAFLYRRDDGSRTPSSLKWRCRHRPSRDRPLRWRVAVRRHQHQRRRRPARRDDSDGGRERCVGSPGQMRRRVAKPRTLPQRQKSAPPARLGWQRRSRSLRLPARGRWAARPPLQTLVEVAAVAGLPKCAPFWRAARQNRRPAATGTEHGRRQLG